jgi:hypothetical protein
MYWIVLEVNGMRPSFKCLVTSILYGGDVIYFYFLSIVLNDNIVIT